MKKTLLMVFIFDLVVLLGGSRRYRPPARLNLVFPKAGSSRSRMATRRQARRSL
jgi:hypothetical protein